jgi:hypothetical protein
MLDVPTNTSATNANFATLNPLENSSVTYSFANCRATISGVATFATATMDIPPTGKFYWEYTGETTGGFRRDLVGVGRRTTARTAGASLNGDGVEWLGFTGGVYQSNTILATYATWDAADVIGIAYDSATGYVWFSKNGTFINSGNPAAGTGFVATVANNSNLTATISNGGAATFGTIGSINFGQRPFSYTPPTGFKSLNTFNLPEPTIPRGDKYFEQYLYTGNGGGLQVGEIQKPLSLFNLDRSLRFRASNSAYLNRTWGTPTDARKFTCSFWLKRGLLSGAYQPFGGGTAAANAGGLEITINKS